MYVSWHCFSGSDSGKDSVKTSGLSWLNLSFLGLHPKQTEKGQEAQADHKPVRGFGRRMQNNAVLFCFLVQEQNSNFTCGVRENFEMMNTPVLETSLCAFLKRCDCTAPSFQKKRNSIAWKFSSMVWQAIVMHEVRYPVLMKKSYDQTPGEGIGFPKKVRKGLQDSPDCSCDTSIN